MQKTLERNRKERVSPTLSRSSTAMMSRIRLLGTLDKTSNLIGRAFHVICEQLKDEGVEEDLSFAEGGADHAQCINEGWWVEFKRVEFKFGEFHFLNSLSNAGQEG